MPLHGGWCAGVLRLLRATCVLFVLVAWVVGSPVRVQAAPLSQDPVAGEQTFKAKCAACHTIGGGKLVGPDLKGVTTQRDAAWLKQFIAEPDKVLASGDPLATQLLQARAPPAGIPVCAGWGDRGRLDGRHPTGAGATCARAAGR